MSTHSDAALMVSQRGMTLASSPGDRTGAGLGGQPQCAVQPPSIIWADPVIALAASEHRNRT